MKIAYFSPFSPDRSGISDFSEELVMELSKYCQMDLYAAKPIANEEICSKFPVFQITEINDSNKRKQYDHLIYQAGNNRNYHKAVIDTFLKYPGILELHDLSLHYYLAEDTYVQKDFDKYIEIMKYCHGKKGEEAAKRFLKGEITAPWENQSETFMVNKHLIDRASAVIVHSDLAKQTVKALRPQAPVIQIPLHTPDIVPEYAAYREKSKRQLNLEQKFVFGSFGYATSAKRIEPIIRALARLKKETSYRFQYLIVGKVENVPVEQLKKKYDLEEEIVVTGFVPLDTFKTYMGACDICFNLRYPTQGESSASLHRMLGMGKAVLVTKIGSFLEYPDDVVIKISHYDSEIDEIVQALISLLNDKEKMERQQEAAYQYACKYLNLQQNAKLYNAFLNQVKDDTFTDSYEDYVLDTLHSMDFMNEKYALRVFEAMLGWIIET